MTLAILRIFAACAVVFVCCLNGIAIAGDTGNVLVNSDPQGALVTINGDITLSGVTPIKFDLILSGQYKIEVNRDGFEKHRSTAYFTETQLSKIDIKLTPKTRTRAFFRSLIVPGWGQRYYGDKTKSALFLLGSAASLVGYVLVKDDYDSKAEVYHETLLRRAEVITNNGNVEEYNAISLEVFNAQKEADDAESKVNLLVGVAAGIYILNLLDSFLFFPDFNTYTEYKAITVRPDIDSESAGICMTLKF